MLLYLVELTKAYKVRIHIGRIDSILLPDRLFQIRPALDNIVFGRRNVRDVRQDVAKRRVRISLRAITWQKSVEGAVSNSVAHQFKTTADRISMRPCPFQCLVELRGFTVLEGQNQSLFV